MALSLEKEDADEFAVKPFTIPLQLLTATQEQSMTALIDSGVDCNVLSYDIWTSLGKIDLVPLKFISKTSQGQKQQV